MPSLIDWFGSHIVRNVHYKLMWILCFIFVEFRWKFSYLNCWIWSWNKEHHWCEMLMFFFWIFMEPFFLELLLLWTCDKEHHLSTKEGCLFVCQIETKMPLPMLLVPLKSPWWIGVHQVGFIMFQSTVEKLLNTKQFFHWKFI
jgi:hypothetical protein